MARSRMLLAVLSVALALGGCSLLERPPVPSAVVVAPAPQAYTCAMSRRAAVEFDALPIGSALRTYMNDYAAERRELRRVLEQPDPPKCPPAVSPAT
jgi:hypothetical protein